MPRFLFVLALAVAALLQAAALPDLAWLQVRPNLVLVLILLWTVARGPREGALWAFGVGVGLDLLTLTPLGSHGLALLSVVAIGALNRRPRFRLGVLPIMASALLATLLHDAVLLAVQRALDGLLSSLTQLSLLAGLLNLAAVPLVYLLTDRLNTWLVEQEATVGRPRPPGAARGLPRR